MLLTVKIYFTYRIVYIILTLAVFKEKKKPKYNMEIEVVLYSESYLTVLEEIFFYDTLCSSAVASQ